MAVDDGDPASQLARAEGQPRAANLSTKVTEWLAKQGLPLELRVARAFRAQGFQVQSNRFVDVPGVRRPREIDVLAVSARNTALLRARFELYVECKWSRDKPWVVFASDGAGPPVPAILQAVPANPMGEALLWLLQDSDDLASLIPFATSGPLAHGGRRSLGKDGNRLDRFYAAMQSVTTIARAGVSAMCSQPTTWEPSYEPAFAFPVVVIDAPLFEARLAEGSDDLSLAPIERARVLWRGFRAEDLFCVELVRAASVEAFAADCAAGLQRAFDPLSLAHAEVMQAIHTNNPAPLSHRFYGRTLSPPIVVPTILRALATMHLKELERRISS